MRLVRLEVTLTGISHAPVPGKPGGRIYIYIYILVEFVPSGTRKRLVVRSFVTGCLLGSRSVV